MPIQKTAIKPKPLNLFVLNVNLKYCKTSFLHIKTHNVRGKNFPTSFSIQNDQN